MKSNKVPVKYGTIDIKKSAQSDFRHTTVRTVWLETESIKKYYGTTSLLVKLNKCARALLEYALDKMDDKNEIVNDSAFKEGFNKLLVGSDEKPYGSGTINKAFKELTNEELVYPLKKRGSYFISPVYFYSGDEEKRTKLVRKWLERPIEKELAFARKIILDEKDRKANEEY